jgi:hypothetical protein
MDLLVQLEAHTAVGSSPRAVRRRDGAAGWDLEVTSRGAAPAVGEPPALAAAHAGGRGSERQRRLLHLVGYIVFALAVAGIVLSALILSEPRRVSTAGQPAGATAVRLASRQPESPPRVIGRGSPSNGL